MVFVSILLVVASVTALGLNHAVFAADCGPPPSFQGGSSYHSNTSTGSTVIYRCDFEVGLALVGDAILTCDKSGIWQGQAPTCEYIQSSNCDNCNTNNCNEKCQHCEEEKSKKVVAFISLSFVEFCVIIALIIIIIIIMVRRRRRKRRNQKDSKTGTKEQDSRTTRQTTEMKDCYTNIGPREDPASNYESLEDTSYISPSYSVRGQGQGHSTDNSVRGQGHPTANPSERSRTQGEIKEDNMEVPSRADRKPTHPRGQTRDLTTLGSNRELEEDAQQDYLVPTSRNRGKGHQGVHTHPSPSDLDQGTDPGYLTPSARPFSEGQENDQAYCYVP